MAGVSAPLKAAPLEAGVSAPVKAAPMEAVWLAHVPCAADPLRNAVYLPLDWRQESCFHSYSSKSSVHISYSCTLTFHSYCSISSVQNNDSCPSSTMVLPYSLFFHQLGRFLSFSTLSQQSIIL
jgi:hypothetical protein